MKNNKIDKTRRKILKQKLMNEIKDVNKEMYLSYFFSYLQFLTRVISFFIIAINIEKIINKVEIKLIESLLLLLIVNIFGFLLSSYAKKYQGIVSNYGRNSIKRKFLNAFKDNHKNFKNDQSSVDILNVASYGIDSLDTFYNLYLQLNFRSILNCTTVFILVFFIKPYASLIFLILLPLIPISIMLMQKASAKIMQEYWNSYGDVSNLFIDNLSGLNTLYVHNAIEKYENDFNNKAEKFRLATMKLLSFQLQSVGYMDFVMYLGVGLSGYYIINSYLTNSITIFQVIFFILIASEFFTPIRELGYCMHLLMMNIKMADKIFTFLDSVSTKTENEDINLKNVDKLTIKDLSFSYDLEKLITNINLIFEKGKFYSIAGKSGSGKSTLAKLILKELSASEGQIFFDNHNIDNLTEKDISAIVSYTSFDSFIFNGTIMDNLIIATDKNESEIIEFLKENNLMNFAFEFKNGLDSQVGEGGKLLSFGQKQQLLVARSMLSNHHIYIYDEITSNIDEESSNLILNMLKSLAKNKIVIFITHKMKQVLDSDLVIYIDNTKLFLSQPDLLLKDNQSFKESYYKQKELEEILNEKNI